MVLASEAKNQTMMASTCAMSLKEERSTMIVPSPSELRAKAKERLYQAEAYKVKELKD